MTELQEQIAEKKAQLAMYKKFKGKYSKYPDSSAWDYFTVKTLKEELKELEEIKESC